MMTTIGAIIAFFLGLGWLGLLLIIAVGVVLLIALGMITETIKAVAGKKNNQKGVWY